MDASDYLAAMRLGEEMYERDGDRLAALTDREAAAEGRAVAASAARQADAAEDADPDLAALLRETAANLARRCDLLDGTAN